MYVEVEVHCFFVSLEMVTAVRACASHLVTVGAKVVMVWVL